jgi:hypothetical protein
MINTRHVYGLMWSRSLTTDCKHNTTYRGFLSQILTFNVSKHLHKDMFSCCCRSLHQKSRLPSLNKSGNHYITYPSCVWIPKKLFYLNFNIHSYQFFQCSCNIPIMHWETLEKQFPNQIETIFFLNNIIFYHMFMLSENGRVVTIGVYWYQ